MDVWICTYTHKHGTDVGAYRTEAGAWKAAWQLANERVDESWDEEDKARFKVIDNSIEALDLFHDIEGNISYGESFEIHRRPLGD